jgi:hypothetical protein
MSLNKVITSVNALVNNVSIPDDQLNNVVCIDLENNRIGVKNGNPDYEIDISGTLKTNFIYINNQNNPTNSFDVTYEANLLRFSRGLELIEDLSCENIRCNAIDASGIITDISFIENVDINKNLKVIGDLSCENIRCNAIDASGIITDISFIENVDINKDLKVIGELRSDSGVYTTSDDRYKHNEKIITNGLEIIRQLQPQTYDKTRTFKDIDFQGVVNEPHITEAGLIAQELHAINDISFAVTEGDKTNPYYLRYNNVFIFGLAAVKELDNIVSNLSDRVSNISNGTPDITDVNLSNILDFVKNQNTLIQTLNQKITNLETRVINLEY